MMNLLNLLKQRRVWASIVCVVGFFLQLFGYGDIDQNELTSQLLSIGVSLSSLIAGFLALLSYAKPKINK